MPLLYSPSLRSDPGKSPGRSEYPHIIGTKRWGPTSVHCQFTGWVGHWLTAARPAARAGQSASGTPPAWRRTPASREKESTRHARSCQIRSLSLGVASQGRTAMRGSALLLASSDERAAGGQVGMVRITCACRASSWAVTSPAIIITPRHAIRRADRYIDRTQSTNHSRGTE